MSADYSAIEFARRYDEHMAGELMDRYFGDCGFFNTGYWTEETTTVRAAAERLLDEICAPLPTSTRSILDVGCGTGGTTASLSRRFPKGSVIGVNISIQQLADGRRAGRTGRLACMDAAALAFQPSCFEAVVAVESALHFRSRSAFFRGAASALVAGGWLVLSDVLFLDPSAVGAWMIPSPDQPRDLTEYRALLDAELWSDIRLSDVTSPCWLGFCDQWEQWIESLADEKIIDDGMRDANRRLVATWRQRTVAHYLIVAARRRGNDDLS